MSTARLILFALGLTGLLTTATAADSARWWRGNLHTHSFWSDGDDFPEMIAERYKLNGYHFLAFTDHNTLHTSNKWVNTESAKSAKLAYPKYAARWSKGWIETRPAAKDGQTEVRQIGRAHV